jgi:hypothetical protein
MAMDYMVERLELGDVVLVDVPGLGQVEATVARPIVRTKSAVQATFRVEGQDEFVKEWAVGDLVTVVRGP